MLKTYKCGITQEQKGDKTNKTEKLINRNLLIALFFFIFNIIGFSQNKFEIGAYLPSSIDTGQTNNNFQWVDSIGLNTVFQRANKKNHSE